MSNFEYCIGFLLPKELNDSCKEFAKEIEKEFPEFNNKLNQRLAHIKIKSPFTATQDELVKLFNLLNSFTLNLEPLELRFGEILFRDEEKLVLSVVEADSDQLTKLEELKMNLCALLLEAFPERITPSNEQLFEPRVTIGFYKEVDTLNFINFCGNSIGDFIPLKFSVQEIALFEKDVKKGTQWKPKVNFFF